MAPKLADSRVVRYFKEVRAEIRKVTWPSRTEVTRLSTIVVVVLFAASIVLAVVDYAFSWLMEVIVNLGTSL
jgi:preprotein translocase subunit SecE